MTRILWGIRLLGASTDLSAVIQNAGNGRKRSRLCAHDLKRKGKVQIRVICVIKQAQYGTLVDQIPFPGGTGINLSTSRSSARPTYNYPHSFKLLPQPPPRTIPEILQSRLL